MKNKLTTLGVCAFATNSFAAISFTEDFSSNTIGTNFINTDAATNGGIQEPTFANGEALFFGAGDAGRSYIGTVSTDFNTVDFSAQVDVTIQSGGGANAFIGLGPGIVGGDGTGGGAAFGEPTGGPTNFLTINANNRAGGTVAFGDFGPGTNNANSGTDTTNPVVGDGNHTVFLDFDSATQMLTFSASVNGAPVITLGTIDGSDNMFDNTNSRIFFGGDDNTTFDNFSVTVPAVIPEPSSAILLSVFGMLGLIRRRR